MSALPDINMSPRCPVCATDITVGEMAEHTHRCERCDTLHHKDCWEYTGGCAIFGCNTLPAPNSEEMAARIAAVPELTMQLHRYLNFRRHTVFLQYIAGLTFCVSIPILVVSNLLGPLVINVYIYMATTVGAIVAMVLASLAYFASAVLQIVERFVKPKGAEKLLEPKLSDEQVLAQAKKLKLSWATRPIASYLSFTSIPIVLKLSVAIAFFLTFIADRFLVSKALFDSSFTVFGLSLFLFLFWYVGWEAARESVLVATLENRLDNQQANSKEMESHRCPVCNGEILANEEHEAIECPVCIKLHHKECYTFAKGCAELTCRDSSYALALPDVPPSLLYLQSALKYQTAFMAAISVSAFLGLIGFFVRMATVVIARLTSTDVNALLADGFFMGLAELTVYPVIAAIFLSFILILLCIPTVLARLYIDYRLRLTLKNSKTQPRQLLDSLASGTVSTWCARQIEKVQPYALKSLYLVPIIFLLHFASSYSLPIGKYFRLGHIGLLLMLTSGPIVAINSRIAYLVALKNRITASFKK